MQSATDDIKEYLRKEPHEFYLAFKNREISNANDLCKFFIEHKIIKSEISKIQLIHVCEQIFAGAK